MNFLIYVKNFFKSLTSCSPSASRVNDPPSKSVAPLKLVSTIFVPSEKSNFVLLSDVAKVTPVPDTVLTVNV